MAGDGNGHSKWVGIITATLVSIITALTGWTLIEIGALWTRDEMELYDRYIDQRFKNLEESQCGKGSKSFLLNMKTK